MSPLSLSCKALKRCCQRALCKHQQGFSARGWLAAGAAAARCGAGSSRGATAAGTATTAAAATAAVKRLQQQHNIRGTATVWLLLRTPTAVHASSAAVP
eukprot:15768-Heterococcus_DN1.PRE.1